MKRSMDQNVKRGVETSPKASSAGTSAKNSPGPLGPWTQQRPSRRRGNDTTKRRCISTACTACRRRKSKCDGAYPACAACVSVYNTECIYDPASDHRRKGVYKRDIDTLKTRNSTLQALVQAILNAPEDEAYQLVSRIRSCESLDKVAEEIQSIESKSEDEDDGPMAGRTNSDDDNAPTFESRLSSKMGELRLDNGTVRMLGGTSNLLFIDADTERDDSVPLADALHDAALDPITSWTRTTNDSELINHLLNHYFTWHYTFFTILPKDAFYRHFQAGKPPVGSRRQLEFCTPLLVNAMLALGCHFTSSPAARTDPEDSSTAGDHFFSEARTIIYEEEELATPRLATVQALALMSVREAGCGREAHGWVYSGMAFRMACDLGLSYSSNTPTSPKDTGLSSNEEEEDARRITFWGCFMIDKCWSNYLGRLPIFQLATNITVPKFDVFPSEDSDNWSPYSDSGFSGASSQPSRARAVALQISILCEISSDLIKYFYHPQQTDKPLSKSAEMNHLSDIHSRLEAWKRDLSKELEPKEGTLSSIIVMHMFFQLLYIHLFRPFLKYTQKTSPLPNNVSPRRLCTQAAGTISKLLRLYKRSYGLRQIVNIAVYITHSACTIHLLNLPEKTARRDITYGVKHLEEIAEGWLCARRTLAVLSAQAKKWQVDLPNEAASVLVRTDDKFGALPIPTIPVKTPEYSSKKMSRRRQQSIGSVSNIPSKQSNLHHGNSEGYGVNVPTAQSVENALASSRPSAPYGYSAPARGSQSATMKINTGNNPQWHNSNQLSFNTEQSTQSQQEQKRNSKNGPARSENSEMFGGVEALLREGQDWWMKDQSHVASGFENWDFGVDKNNFLPKSNQAQLNQQSTTVSSTSTTTQNFHDQNSTSQEVVNNAAFSMDQLVGANDMDTHAGTLAFANKIGSTLTSPTDGEFISNQHILGNNLDMSADIASINNNNNNNHNANSNLFRFGGLASAYNEEDWYR